MSNLTTLATLETVNGQATKVQAEAFGLTPLAFGNMMKGLVKADLAWKNQDSPKSASYHLTETGIVTLANLRHAEKAEEPTFVLSAEKIVAAAEPITVREADPVQGFAIPAPKAVKPAGKFMVVCVVTESEGFRVIPTAKGAEQFTLRAGELAARVSKAAIKKIAATPSGAMVELAN